MPGLRTLAFLLLTVPAHAHIGSPDTFVQTTAGPYTLLIAAHPPLPAPGAYEIDLRFSPDDHLTAATASLDNATPTSFKLFTDGTATVSLWAATSEAHTLHLAVQGSRGPGTLSLTLPALSKAPATATTHRYELFFAVALCLLLLATWFAFRAVFRYAAVALVLALLLFALGLTGWLFSRAAKGLPTTLTANLSADGRLDFHLVNPADPNDTFADLIPDHGKLLHLFLIRDPNRDVLLHLHPEQTSPGHFTVLLPAMPPGAYTLYADFYRRDGRGDTAIRQMSLPMQSTRPLTNPDDSYANLPPLGRTASPMERHPYAGSPQNRDTLALQNAANGAQAVLAQGLPDGYEIHLITAAKLHPMQPIVFHVELYDPTGHPPSDMALYLGMNAHAIVVRTDGKPGFAHIHPGGTLPMLMPAADMANMPGMDMSAPVSNIADIPYGFPAPGSYRLFVQMKHGRIVETGAFDLNVQ